MKIVVTGSLGNIGLPLTQQLVKTGNAVTVVSSHMDRKVAIENMGATAAIGKVDDADFLKGVFKKADAVFLMIPPNFAEADVVAYYQRVANAYSAALKDSEVRRLVHLSSYGAHLSEGTGFILGSYYSENIINNIQGVDITHLRAGFFYNNLFGFSDMIKHADAIMSNYGGDDKMILVAPEDIAKAAAEELQQTKSSIRYVVSQEATSNQVAHALGKAIGKPKLKWIRISDEQAKAAMLKNGMPNFVVDNFIQLGASLHSGLLLSHYENNKPQQYGAVKLKDFVEVFASQY